MGASGGGQDCVAMEESKSPGYWWNRARKRRRITGRALKISISSGVMVGASEVEVTSEKASERMVREM